MELLDGLDADSLVRRFGPVPPERAIYLLRQVCHSLSEAQSRGLVHRDIKPANIFLCRYGEEYDFVKVLDFGIVRHRPRPRGHEPAADAGERGPRYAGVHRPRAGDGHRHGRARRHLCDRLRGLLAADRAARVHRRHPHGAPRCSTRKLLPTPPIRPDRAADPRGTRRPRAGLPGQGPRGSAAVRQRTVGAAGRGGGASDWTQDRAREWWETYQ